VRAARFVRSSLTDASGLKHVCAAGSWSIAAFLDDHAFFGRACLDLFAVLPQKEFLEGAIFCVERLLEEFHDELGGGFYFTGSRSEALIARTCDLHDGAVPAGNSVAAELLLRLWSLTGEERYRQAGQEVLDRFLGDAQRNPYGGSHLIAVAARSRRGWRTVAVVGERSARERLAAAARAMFDPGCTVIALESPQPEWYPRGLHGKKGPEKGAWAYVCEGSTCTLPLTTEEALSSSLQRNACAPGSAMKKDRR